LSLSEGSATELVIPKGTNALSETSEGKGDSACTSIVEKGDQEIVNIYYINENNLYGCPHVQLDIGKEKLIAVLDTRAEISLMPEKIFESLLAKCLKVPQLPVVNGALITAFGNRTKRIKRQALVEFKINGFSYEQVFMIAPNLVPDAILGVNFLKENNVVIDLTEGRIKARKGGSDCEHEFFYGSLPKNKFEVGFISNSEIQPKFSVLRRQ
jgi:predicted aspartyl protease